MDGVIVLISGRGSNLKAIYNTNLKNIIKCVISNRDDAPGLQFAKDNNLNTEVIVSSKFNSREEFEKQLALIIDKYNPKLIVLAGFMRILSATFIHKYAGKIINIHPSLLPAFPGAHAAQLAINAKVKVSGATVHFVTEEVDAGSIIAQGIVQVNSTDSVNELADRILEVEHIIYPFVIKKILLNKISINKEQAVIEKEPEDEKNLGKHFYSIFY